MPMKRQVYKAELSRQDAYPKNEPRIHTQRFPCRRRSPFDLPLNRVRERRYSPCWDWKSLRWRDRWWWWSIESPLLEVFPRENEVLEQHSMTTAMPSNTRRNSCLTRSSLSNMHELERRMPLQVLHLTRSLLPTAYSSLDCSNEQ